MKKIIAAALALMLALTAFCCAATDFTGTWYSLVFGMVVELNLAEDGTYTITFDGDASDPGTWEAEDDSVYMDRGTDAETVFTYDGEALAAFAEEGGMTFTREMPEMFAPAAIAENAAVEDFAGEWDCTMISMFGMTIEPEIAGVDMHISVEGKNVTLISDALVGEPLTVEASVENGTMTVMKIDESEEEEGAEFILNMLEDGMMRVEITISGETAVLYMEKAE